MREFGVHSEVGKLRTVMVCRPALAHQRLTPGNCHALLFDDVIWVHEAQKDHYDFVLKMQERGVEVLELHDLLAETLDDQRRPQLRARPADHGERGRHSECRLHPAVARRDAGEAAGATPDRRNRDLRSARRHSGRRCWARPSADAEFILPPIPNTLFQRDPSCWIYGGVTCNPMYWPARKPETLLQRAVYKFHPQFKGGNFKIWWGDSDEHFARRLDGGRRRHADRQGRRADRHGRAHHASGRRPGRAGAVQATRRRRA